MHFILVTLRDQQSDDSASLFASQQQQQQQQNMARANSPEVNSDHFDPHIKERKIEIALRGGISMTLCDVPNLVQYGYNLPRQKKFQDRLCSNVLLETRVRGIDPSSKEDMEPMTIALRAEFTEMLKANERWEISWSKSSFSDCYVSKLYWQHGFQPRHSVACPLHGTAEEVPDTIRRLKDIFGVVPQSRDIADDHRHRMFLDCQC